MLNIAICDDNPIHLKNFKTKVDHILCEIGSAFDLSAYSSAEEMLSNIKEDSPLHLAILDIEMDGVSGISLAKKLNTIIPSCRIIFLTSYIDYAPEVYETDHCWFVVKNRSDEFLKPAINKALCSINSEENEVSSIMIRENGRRILVPVKDIIYIGKIGRKSYIHCSDRDYYDSRRPALLIPESISDHFLRCHQGYWVNLQMITELDHEELVLNGGIRVPISRTYRDSVRKTFFERFQ